MPKRHAWTTRFGFYLVAIGSACGLGNLWRFPYVVGENGGGAFVLLYILLTMTVGLPLLVGELLLGKSSKMSVLLAMVKMQTQSRLPFRWLGRFSVLLSLAVLSYYAVISGWVLHFLMQFSVGLVSRSTFDADLVLGGLMKNGLLQVALASVHLLFALIIVVRGVQEGLEKWIGNMMPIFVFLLLVLMGKALSLPSAEDGLRFLFYPDFSKLSWDSLNSALGHVFFTLSIGFGTMVTFGSYLHSHDPVPAAGARVAFADLTISLLAGLLVFPVVLSASTSHMTDPTLLFDALPRFFASIPGGLVFATAFFICLYLAALGASIGLFEVIVSNALDRFKGLTRNQASWGTGIVALLFSVGPALSSSLLSEVRFFEKGILETVDAVLISFILPLVALGMSLAIHKGLTREVKDKEFLAKENVNTAALYPHWLWALKWWIPSIIILGLLLKLIRLIL